MRDLFPNNMIPTSRFATTSSAIAQFGKAVQPNRGGVPGTSAYVRQNYIVSGGTLVTPTDKWSVKGDQMIGNNHRLSFLWNTTIYRRKAGPAGAPGLPEPLWNGQLQAWDTEAYRVTEAIVRVGSGTTTDLLDAQSSLTLARLTLARNEYERAIAYVQLERATGATTNAPPSGAR